MVLNFQLQFLTGFSLLLKIKQGGRSVFVFFLIIVLIIFFFLLLFFVCFCGAKLKISPHILIYTNVMISSFVLISRTVLRAPTLCPHPIFRFIAAYFRLSSTDVTIHHKTHSKTNVQQHVFLFTCCLFVCLSYFT